MVFKRIMYLFLYDPFRSRLHLDLVGLVDMPVAGAYSRQISEELLSVMTTQSGFLCFLETLGNLYFPGKPGKWIFFKNRFYICSATHFLLLLVCFYYNIASKSIVLNPRSLVCFDSFQRTSFFV